MPRGDRTGPAGMGPMTGRAAGYCAGLAAPGYVSGGGYGRGTGQGRGSVGGRGWRNRFYATGIPGWAALGSPSSAYPRLDPAWERQVLQAQAETLQADLDAVQKRLAKVEKTTAGT